MCEAFLVMAAMRYCSLCSRGHYVPQPFQITSKNLCWWQQQNVCVSVSACKFLLCLNSLNGFIVQHSYKWELQQRTNRNNTNNYLTNASLYNCISPL